MPQTIPFHKPTRTGRESAHLRRLLDGERSLQESDYAERCATWLSQRLGGGKVFLTTSCTHALEMSALLAGIEPGDEVILQSFAFTSTANAFALRGAALRFVDMAQDDQARLASSLAALADDVDANSVPVAWHSLEAAS